MQGQPETGKQMYFMTHAYHHVIAEIVEMLGPQRARVKNVRWIYSCKRGWTEFFRDGAKEDTTFHKFPPGEITWFGCFDWTHSIPGGKD
jgi:hypothetical protein